MNDGYPVQPPYSRAGLLAKLTGAAILAAGALLHGQGTALLATLPLGTAGRVMVAGASAPAWSDSGLSYASGVLTVAGSVPGTPSAGQVVIGGGVVKAGGAVTFASTLSVAGAITHSGVNTSSGSTAGRLAYFGGTSGDGAAFEIRGSTYSGSPDTGFLRVGGTYVANWSTAGITLSTGTLTLPNGSAAAPGFRLAGSASGLYYVTASVLGLSVNGAATFKVYTPNGSTYGGAIALNSPSAAEGAIIFNETATSFCTYSGGSSVNLGGWTKAYGQTHATKPNYVEFGRTSTVSAYFDGSGNLTCSGTITFPNGTAAAPGVRTGDAHGLYRLSSTELGFSASGVAVGSVTSAGRWNTSCASTTSNPTLYAARTAASVTASATYECFNAFQSDSAADTATWYNSTFRGRLDITGTGSNSGYDRGMTFEAYHRGSGTRTSLVGAFLEVGTYNGGSDSAGTITTLRGIHLQALKTTSSTITTSALLELGANVGTTKYAIRTASTSGIVSIGDTSNGALTVAGKITAKVAVPGSFADLAAVQSYLASILT